MKHALILIVFALSACENVYEYGNGNISSEERSVEEFSMIEVSGPFEINLEEGRSEKVRVITDENLHKYIQITVEGDELKIETTENIQSDDGIEVYITFNQIDQLELKGACTLTSGSRIKSKDLYLRVMGAGVVDLDIDVRDLEVDLSGAGLIQLSGKAKRQKVDLGGAGNYNAYDLRCEEADIDLSGFGAAQINVSEKLKGKVTGVGSINYKGNPEKVESDISGVGKINPASEDDESEVQIDI